MSAEPSSADSAARRNEYEQELLSWAVRGLVACESETAVFAQVEEFFSRLLPECIVLVNRTTPDMRHLVCETVLGADGHGLMRAGRLLGVDVVGSTWEIKDRASYFTPRLWHAEDGLTEFVMGAVPKPIVLAVQKAVGIHDAYAIGIADEHVALGNVCVFTRRPNVVLPVHVIEAFVYPCFVTLERVRATRQLAEAAERYRLLFENMSEGFALHEVVFDSSGRPVDYRFIHVNRAFEQATGLVGKEIVGDTVLELTPDFSMETVLRYAEVAETGVPLREVQFFEGLQRHLEVVTYSPAENQFATIVSDISERMAAEEALAASEHSYRVLTESIKDVVWTLDPETRRFIYVSPSIERMRGFTPEEVITQDMEAALTPESAQMVQEIIAAGMARFEQDAEREDTYFTAEVEQPCKDGSVVQTEVVANLYRNPTHRETRGARSIARHQRAPACGSGDAGERGALPRTCGTRALRAVREPKRSCSPREPGMHRAVRGVRRGRASG